MTSLELWLRIAIGASLFSAGCWVAYRTDGLKGGILAYGLIVLGLVVALWGGLWS